MYLYRGYIIRTTYVFEGRYGVWYIGTIHMYMYLDVAYHTWTLVSSFFLMTHNNTDRSQKMSDIQGSGAYMYVYTYR